MNAFVLGTVSIAVALAVSIAGLLLIRRRVATDRLRLNHEVAAVMISVLGTLYAIVLGLVVVDALAHREIAEAQESTEANALATIFHLVRTLPVEVRRPIMQASLDYSVSVLEREWKKLSDGTAPDKETARKFGDLWEQTVAFEPKTNREQNIHASLISSMTQLSDARRFRIVTCKHGLPSLLWLVLISGGICTIGFTYFFGAESLKAQLIMTLIVTFMLSLNILLVYFYGRPYRGDLHIEPLSFMHVRNILERAPVLKEQKTVPQPATSSER